METNERLALGVEHYRAGRLREAAGCFVQVLQEQPEHSDAMHLLGLAMNRMGHPEQALDLFDRVLVVEPAHAPALANRSLPLRTLGRLTEAEASLHRALQARPSFPQARVMLGQVMLARKDPEAALRAGRDALADAPERRDAHEVVGHALLQLGRAERALPHLQSAASGGSLGALLSLVQALLLCGQRTAAVELLVG
ncbi:MAG: protein O-GlcNAc transferase, partial [Kiritimatiellia bacterium]